MTPEPVEPGPIGEEGTLAGEARAYASEEEAFADQRQALTGEEQVIVAVQLGREPRDVSGVAVRCPFGCPVVIETRPWLSGGAPNPTLLYLTCPVLVAAVSRVEAGGGVRALKAAFASDGLVRKVLLEVSRAYQARRAALEVSDRAGESGLRGSSGPEAPGGSGSRTGGRSSSGWAGPRDLSASGIGGPSDPGKASCLHAYAAALLAARGGWLPLVPGVDAVWERLGLPTDSLWCEDDRCSERARQSPRAEVT
jgi:hypothetical protein